MPQRPPATRRIRKGDVIGVLAEEVTVITTVRSTVERNGVGRAHGEVNLNKEPTRAKGASSAVGDEEEAVRGSGDSRMKTGAGEERERERRVIGRAHRNDSVGGNGGDRRNGR